MGFLDADLESRICVGVIHKGMFPGKTHNRVVGIAKRKNPIKRALVHQISQKVVSVESCRAFQECVLWPSICSDLRSGAFILQHQSVGG